MDTIYKAKSVLEHVIELGRVVGFQCESYHLKKFNDIYLIIFIYNTRTTIQYDRPSACSHHHHQRYYYYPYEHEGL